MQFILLLYNSGMVHSYSIVDLWHATILCKLYAIYVMYNRQSLSDLYWDNLNAGH